VGKAKGAKHVKLGYEPQPEKKPKLQDPCIDGQPLAWRFSGADRGGPFCWAVQPAEKFQEVLEKLQEFEAKNWAEIIAGKSHPVAVKDLCKDARDRLGDIERDDVDELMSFRLTGTNRVWCVQSGHVMRVLWWDPDHQVYPLAKDKADRGKGKRK
jgi:hypothetical protein